MSLEDTLTKLKEAFTGKTAEAEAHASQVAKLNDVLASKEAELSEVITKLANFEAMIASNEAKLAEAVAAAEKAIKEKAAVEASYETASKKAAKIAASVGVEPVEVSPALVAEAGKTDEEVAQEWAVLRQKDPKAASEFYTKNRASILRASGLR